MIYLNPLNNVVVSNNTEHEFLYSLLDTTNKLCMFDEQILRDCINR